MKPANAPIKARRASRCQTFCENPISSVQTPMAKAERSTMSLRPSRSDILPQIGAAKAAMKEVIDASNPVQNSTWERLSTPK